MQTPAAPEPMTRNYILFSSIAEKINKPNALVIYVRGKESPLSASRASNSLSTFTEFLEPIRLPPLRVTIGVL